MEMDKERNFKHDQFCTTEEGPIGPERCVVKTMNLVPQWIMLTIPPLVLGGSVVVCCVSCCCGKDGRGGA